MVITNKKYVMLIGILIGIALLMWLTMKDQKTNEPMKFIPILPVEIYKNRATDSLPFRHDFFAVMNVNRSDSAALLHAVAQHACQATDSMSLRKYSLYGIEYYEYGVYMNDSTSHRIDNPLYQIANEIDAFIYWIYYEKGELSMIKWYKDGRAENQVLIPITKEVRQLFNHCRQQK